MKTFVNPKIEIVQFGKADIITSSGCPKDCNCVDCTVCPPGSNDCMYVETCPDYCARLQG